MSQWGWALNKLPLVSKSTVVQLKVCSLQDAGFLQQQAQAQTAPPSAGLEEVVHEFSLVLSDVLIHDEIY